MNPKTGEILAMAQYPTYENNRMARIIPSYYYNQLEQDPAHPLLNYAIQTEYPAGLNLQIVHSYRSIERGRGDANHAH